MNDHEIRRLTLGFTLIAASAVAFIATASAMRATDYDGMVFGGFISGFLFAFGVSALLWANKA